eukprot:6850488-Pyramimonas_sp.AAC.1
MCIRDRRQALMANVVCKHHHRFLRRLGLDFLFKALLESQVGGVPKRSADTAVHMVRASWALADIHKHSSASLFVDLRAAFYSAIRQFAVSLPRDAEDLEHVLQYVELPEVLVAGIRHQLETKPFFEESVDHAHLLDMIRETQEGPLWRVPGASQWVAPRTGARPGTVFAGD